MSNNPDDICLWPDGSWCCRDELQEFGQGKSDDFEIVPYGCERYWELNGEPVDALEMAEWESKCLNPEN